MSVQPIDSPKVFISYAWESDEYKDRVKSFATELMNAGIEVVLDQWDLRAGNDMNAFMETSVTDESVTNVLILLSPTYESKANGRMGGVGAETQIISPEVYGRVDQTKFLPIVFLRSSDASISKPAYLRSILHFDLSNPNSYNSEYQRLVKTLYGVETSPKPELGVRPAWVDDGSSPPTRDLLSLDMIKGNDPPQIRRAAFLSELSKAVDEILCWDKTPADYSCKHKYLNAYLDVLPLRNTFNRVVRCYPYVDDGYVLVTDALERLWLGLDDSSTDARMVEMRKTLTHELFLYFVAIAYGYGDEFALGHVFSRDYQYGRSRRTSTGFGLFFHHDDELCSEINRRDGKPWLSPMARFWLENIDPDTCTAEAFVLADELCYNASVLHRNEDDVFLWFPKAYIYDKEFAAFNRFSNGLRSKSQLRKAAAMFGFLDVDGFVERFREVEQNDRAGAYSKYRYFEAFSSAPLLCHFVSSEQLGTRA